MQNNKLLIAFLFLAIASSLFWMSQAQQLEDRFSVLRESFSQDDSSGGIDVGFQESEASPTTCLLPVLSPQCSYQFMDLATCSAFIQCRNNP